MAEVDAAVPLLLPLPLFVDADRRERILAACPVVDEVFRRYAEQGSAPGSAYGIILDGELVYTGSLGVAEVEHQTSVGPDTAFCIASVTKSFLAAAVLHLRDGGKLQLDAQAAHYAPELGQLVYPTRDAAPITVRDLLTMAPGWPEDNAWGDRQITLADAGVDALVRQGIPFANAPGVTFEYSNLAYMILGRIVHRVSGISALTYITEHLLRPLGMVATVWNAAAALTPVATGYRWEDRAWREEPTLPANSDAAAFGGLLSTVRDLARWVAFFLAAWPPRDEPEDGPLRRSSRREMQLSWRAGGLAVTQPSLSTQAQVRTTGYGFGLNVTNDERLRSVGHSGGLPGFGSHMEWLPEHGLGIVALGNRTYAPMRPAASEALRRLVQASSAPARQRLPAPALVAAQAGINQLVARWDEALADSLFAENFFLDEDRHQRRATLAALTLRHGALRTDGPLQVTNALRGRWRLTGQRGWCWLWISLAPTTPPRVQALQITSVLPPSQALATAAARLAGLTQRLTAAAFRQTFAPDVDRVALYEQLQLARLLCGPCTVGEMLTCDGERVATYRLVGPKGALEAMLTLEARGRKLAQAEIRLTGDA